MNKRTTFPFVFWIANSIEVLERFAYYGIYMGFGIYMQYLGYSKAQLGVVQSIFLLFVQRLRHPFRAPFDLFRLVGVRSQT